MTTRDDIVEALFNRFVGIDRFALVDRNLKLWADVDRQPALMFNEARETVARSGATMQAKREVMIDIFVYARTDKKDEKSPKAAVLNQLLDLIDAALKPSGSDILSGRQTLGGLVYACYVEGAILRDNGYIDGQAVAVVPIKMIIPY